VDLLRHLAQLLLMVRPRRRSVFCLCHRAMVHGNVKANRQRCDAERLRATVDGSAYSAGACLLADRLNSDGFAIARAATGSGNALAVAKIRERGGQSDTCMITPDEAGRAMLEKALK
jgi:hypothetical protein